MAPPRRIPARSAAAPVAAQDPWKEWVMVLFESVAVGMMAVILLLAAVLLLIGLYVQLIYPLTNWDFVSVSLEQYSSAVTAILTGVFLAGFAVGYWYISGNAWKKMPRPTGVAENTTRLPRKS
jgi:hypothetical protein